MNQEEIEKYKQAGKIAGDLKKFLRGYVKEGMLLTEIVKTIKDKIENSKAICAFPPTLSIDDIAAHYSPPPKDETKATGIIKVDFGVCIDGYIADTAITLDLTEDNRHKELIEASELALNNALKIINNDITLNDIGKNVQESIESKGFSPINNLSGHSLGRWNVHAGITIPNYANGNLNKLEPGAYAIEPFATDGKGMIQAGGPGNIYELTNPKNPRSPTARKILAFIQEKYKTLPFSLFEIQEKFGPMSRLAINELIKQDSLHSHTTLVEKANGFVSQAEHTFLITNDGEVIVTTLEN
jgi:methionyl aminopeptidase